MACGKIKKGAGYNCTDPLQGGAEPNVIIGNHSDIVSYSKDSDGRVTSITLVNGASLYLYQGFGRSTSPQLEVIKAASGQNLVKHQVGLFVFEDDQDQINNIEDIILGKFFAIVIKSKKNDHSFRVYGLDLGLELVPGTIQNINENNSAYSLILATPDTQGESKLPPVFYDGTSYATTKELIEDMLYIPQVLNLTDITLSTAGGDAVVVAGKNFFGGGTVSDVQSVQWINQSTLSATSQSGLTVASDEQISFNSVALTAGNYKLRVTTTKGAADSEVIIVVS